MNKDLRVNCPQCDLQFYYYQSKFRPFCSEKCKMIDLGHWFEETYTVPVKTIPVGCEEDDHEFENENVESEQGSD